VALLLLAGSRLAQRLRVPLKIHSYVLVAQPVALLDIPARKRQRFSTRMLPRGAPELALLPRPAHAIEARFDQGAYCIGLFHDERFIGCAWTCLGAYEEDEVRCRFEPRPKETAAWDFDVYLMDAFRLGYAFSVLWAAVNEWLAAQRIEWTMSRISSFNPASLRAHARLGAVPLGRMVFFTLGHAQLAVGTLRPRLHLSLGGKPGPRVRLPAPATVENTPLC
jgi:hypothetical protein